MLHSEITQQILKAYYNVYNTLGFGFLEKVYERAMCIELKRIGLFSETQREINVFYKSTLVGSYFADILVNDCVIIELKATESLCELHQAQLLNYLKATDIEIGLLLNFWKKPEYKRMIFENRYKKIKTETQV